MSLGRYELVRPLATSGMAELHLARDGDRMVVIKRLLPALVRRAAMVAQFMYEARIAAKLEHPNLVRVEEIVEGPTDWYYVTEHLAGTSLLDCMKVLTMQGRAMPIECVVAIGIECCAALAFAHGHRDAGGTPIVHRNVSPLNVLLGFDGAIKLGHFGVEGTLGYMSPEQCRGEAVDARSDLFSLGVVLHEVATGRRLFGSRDAEQQVTERILRGAIVPPSHHRASLPQPLEDVILRALQRDRAARCATAAEMQRDLETSLWAGRPSTGAVGELVRKLLRESPAHGTRIVREEDLKTVVRSASAELLATAGAPEAGEPVAAVEPPTVQLGWRRQPRDPHGRVHQFARALPTVATDVQTRIARTWRWGRRLRVALAAVAVVVGLWVSGWAIGRTAAIPAALPAMKTSEPGPAATPPAPATSAQTPASPGCAAARSGAECRSLRRGASDAAGAGRGRSSYKNEPRRARR